MHVSMHRSNWGNLLRLFFVLLFSFCIPAAFADCPAEGRVLTSSTGVIKSNYDGRATYSNNNRCKWVVKVEGAYAYDLEMKTFNIPDYDDFLQIDTCTSFLTVDSVDDCDPGGSRLTGETVSRQFESYVTSSFWLSTALPVVVYFHSNAVDVGQGFELTYSARSCPGSGTTTTNAKGSLTDGPGNYGEFAYCTWTINLAGSSANSIRFEFTELDIAVGDSVLIEECQPAQYSWGRNECTELWEEKGSDAVPPPVTSSATLFQVTFSARTFYAHERYAGFNLQYAPVCGTGYYSSFQGCKPCSTDACPAGQVRSGCQPGAVEDTSCAPCSQALPAIASWTSGCKWTCNSEHFERDGACAPCTVCGDNETEAQVCQGTTDRQCKPCQICSTDEYQVQQCTRSADRSCAACKICTSEEFEASSCSEFEDRQCNTCDTTTQCQQNQILAGCGSGERGSCVCNVGWTASDDGQTCTDIDECADESHDCDASNAVCANNNGGFECGCNPGYSSDGATCLEIDYCVSNPCDAQASCVDEAPPSASGICTCNVGYSGNGVTCEDNDECNVGTHDCDRNAQCTNTRGSFTCACNAGYTGGGLACADLDECASVSDNNCDAKSACSNTAGSFSCQCNAGLVDWNEEGTSCDADECVDGTSTCDAVATCTDTEGSFTCTCPSTHMTADAGVTCTLTSASAQPAVPVLQASTTLEGVALAAFDTRAEAVFKRAVAALFPQTTAADVRVTNTAELPAAGQPERRLLAGARLQVDYEVSGFDSERSVLAAADAIQSSSPELLAALQQDDSFSSLTGVSTAFADIKYQDDTESGVAEGGSSAWGVLLAAGLIALAVLTRLA